jgi:hypothetical protein
VINTIHGNVKAGLHGVNAEEIQVGWFPIAEHLVVDARMVNNLVSIQLMPHCKEAGLPTVYWNSHGYKLCSC